MKRMSTALLLVLLAVLLLALAGSATAQGDTLSDCPRQVNYVYATKGNTNLDALRAEVNALPGYRLPENGRYLVQNILAVQAVYLPSTEWQLVVLLDTLDTCDRP